MLALVLLADERAEQLHDLGVPGGGLVELTAHFGEAGPGFAAQVGDVTAKVGEVTARALKLLVVACRKSRSSVRISETSRSLAAAKCGAAAASSRPARAC